MCHVDWYDNQHKHNKTVSTDEILYPQTPTAIIENKSIFIWSAHTAFVWWLVYDNDERYAFRYMGVYTRQAVRMSIFVTLQFADGVSMAMDLLYNLRVDQVAVPYDWCEAFI